MEMNLIPMVEHVVQRIFALKITEDVNKCVTLNSIVANVSQDMKHLTMAKPVAILMNVYKITAVAHNNAQTPKADLNAHVSKDSRRMKRLAAVSTKTNAMLTMETVTMNAETLKEHTFARVVLATAFQLINIIALTQVLILRIFLLFSKIS